MCFYIEHVQYTAFLPDLTKYIFLCYARFERNLARGELFWYLSAFLSRSVHLSIPKLRYHRIMSLELWIFSWVSSYLLQGFHEGQKRVKRSIKLKLRYGSISDFNIITWFGNRFKFQLKVWFNFAISIKIAKEKAQENIRVYSICVHVLILFLGEPCLPYASRSGPHLSSSR